MRTKRDIRRIESNPIVKGVARSGFVVNGLLHILIGGIAISVATGSRGQEADQSGAMQQLASTPGGDVVLWISAIGLAALGIWEAVQAFISSGRGIRSKAAARVTAAGRAVVYLALAVSAFTFARGGSSSSSSDSRHLSATILQAPGGVVLLVVIGLGITAGGAWFVFSGLTHRFENELRTPSGVAGAVVVTVGVIGYVAQGIAVVVVGILFIIGAVTYDPSKTTGLDGALRSLVSLPFGEVLLTAVGVGLIVYGVFLGIRAVLQKL